MIGIKYRCFCDDSINIKVMGGKTPLQGENAVVLLSYPEKAFGNPKALQAFLSTDVSLSVDETLSYYAGRWILFF